MKIKYTVYYTDNSSGIVECEKPPGAHPDSICALKEGLKQAELTGKIVKSIGRSRIFFGKIIDDLTPRDEIVKG